MKFERIKNLREDSDIPQAQLAQALNISQRTLSHYECGTRDIPINLLMKIADYFDCTVDYLVGRSDRKEHIKDKATEKSIPQYHPAYTEEENLQLHEQIKNATDEELIEWIMHLLDMYPSKEKARSESALNQLIKEITDRYTIKRKYDLLVNCRDEWKAYVNSLADYELAEFFRKKYNAYKRTGTKICKDELCLDSFLRYADNDVRSKGVSVEFVRRSLFNENSSQGIKKKPQPEIFYFSLDDVTVEQMSSTEALKKLGKKSLVKLLIILLQNADATGNDNNADLHIMFLTRKYARQSHKKEDSSFKTMIQDYNQLRDNCLQLLKEIQYYREEAQQYK
ncbi:helix-turn-helix domain-containing protein [Sellimonas intestinalis]|uniref:helix-turn-helix domain-containing protein n=1 Tax=Sellimonas intestinalis TaxID=1653434 RepID=UPI00189ADD0C